MRCQFQSLVSLRIILVLVPPHPPFFSFFFCATGYANFTNDNFLRSDIARGFFFLSPTRLLLALVFVFILILHVFFHIKHHTHIQSKKIHSITAAFDTPLFILFLVFSFHDEIGKITGKIGM